MQLSHALCKCKLHVAWVLLFDIQVSAMKLSDFIPRAHSISICSNKYLLLEIELNLVSIQIK